jgi:hypothetical protein
VAQNTGGMGGLRKVEVRSGSGGGGGAWQELQRGWGATWQLRWPLPPLPLSLRLTADDGAVALLPSVVRRVDELTKDAQLRTDAQFAALPPPPPFWQGDADAAAAMAPFTPCPLGGDLVPASAAARAAAAAAAETATRTFLDGMQALGLQPAEEVPSDAAAEQQQQQPLQPALANSPLGPAAAAAAATLLQFRPPAAAQQGANAAGAGAGGAWGVGFTLSGSLVWGRQPAVAAAVADGTTTNVAAAPLCSAGPGCASPAASAAAVQAVHVSSAVTPHCSSAAAALHGSAAQAPPPPPLLPGWCRLTASLPVTMQPRACVPPPPPACP